MISERWTVSRVRTSGDLSVVFQCLWEVLDLKSIRSAILKLRYGSRIEGVEVG